MRLTAAQPTQRSRHNDYVRLASYADCNSWLRDAIKAPKMTLKGDPRVLSFSTKRAGGTDIATGTSLLKRLANHVASDHDMCKAVGILVRKKIGRTWEFTLPVPLESPIPRSEPASSPGDPLAGLLAHAEEILRVTPQIILQGPPGTGKTYAAKRLGRGCWESTRTS